MNKYALFTALVMATIISVRPSALAEDRYVAQNGQTPGGAFTGWTTAASNIQDAINVAYTNATVWVGAGRYTLPTNAGVYMGTNVVYINRPLTLRSSNGVPATTIIDGAGTNRGIAIAYPTATTNRFIVDGFTISNCYATNYGGGVLIYNGRPGASWTSEVRNCVISDCIVEYGASSGGGIANYCRDTPGAVGAGIIVSNCVIRNNRASTNGNINSAGGGIFINSDSGRMRIAGCLVESNSAVFGGGVNLLELDLSDGRTNFIENCVIRGNTAPNLLQANGGGMYMRGTYTVRNCLFYNNACARISGAFHHLLGRLEMYNCTIISNQAGGSGWGSAFRIDSGTSAGYGLFMGNSIVYSNYNNDDIVIPAGQIAFFTNSCLVKTNYDGVNFLGSGNFTNNPAFADWTNQNYQLKPNSPCVNRGLNQDWMPNAVDLNGRTRIRYGTVDIGAYETIYKGLVFKGY